MLLPRRASSVLLESPPRSPANVHSFAGHTPPVFPVYTSLLTLQWLKNLGGVAAIEKINTEKAALLYTEIDRNPLFEGTAEKESRSLMNVTFVLKDVAHQEKFNEIFYPIFFKFIAIVTGIILCVFIFRSQVILLMLSSVSASKSTVPE